jgi:hypothetical protein
VIFWENCEDLKWDDMDEGSESILSLSLSLSLSYTCVDLVILEWFVRSTGSGTFRRVVSGHPASNVVIVMHK